MAKYRVTKKMIDEVEGLTYEEQVKVFAVLMILQEEGLSPEVCEKCGYHYKGKRCLKIPVSRTKEGMNGSDFLFNTKVYEVLIDLS